MNNFYTIILFLSTFVLFFSLVSKFIKDVFHLPESLISMIFGILMGPYALNQFRSGQCKIVFYTLARVILCVQTMSVSLNLPSYYVIKKWKSLSVLVVFIGIIKCIISTGIVYLIGTYDLVLSWSIGACLTPTDPILSSSIIKGAFASSMVPERVRILLGAESDVNDGLGIILLFIGFDITKHGLLFIMKSFFMKTFISSIIGLLMGLVSKQAFKTCYYKRLIGMDSFISHTFLLVLISIGLMEYVKGYELICIFSCGVVFSSDEWLTLEYSNTNSQEIMDNLLSTSFFVLFGSNLNFSNLTLKTFLSGLLILIIQRPLICLLMYKHIPELKSAKEGLFVGWFGPIGVGAVYYAILVDRTVKSHTMDYVSMIVFLSVVIHGLTVPLYTLLVKVNDCVNNDIENEHYDFKNNEREREWVYK